MLKNINQIMSRKTIKTMIASMVHFRFPTPKTGEHKGKQPLALPLPVQACPGAGKRACQCQAA